MTQTLDAMQLGAKSIQSTRKLHQNTLRTTDPNQRKNTLFLVTVVVNIFCRSFEISLSMGRQATYLSKPFAANVVSHLLARNADFRQHHVPCCFITQETRSQWHGKQCSPDGMGTEQTKHNMFEHPLAMKLVVNCRHMFYSFPNIFLDSFEGTRTQCTRLCLSSECEWKLPFLHSQSPQCPNHEASG
eukprot:3718555-Amphidinium_carterae.1